MSIGRRLIGDTLVYGVALALSRGLTFALLPVFTRVLTPAEYGSYDVATSLTRALFVPAVLGIDSGIALLLRRRQGERRDTGISSALAAQVVWAGLVAATTWYLAPQLAQFMFADAQRAELVRFAAVFLIVLVVNNFVGAVLKWRREPARFLLLTVASAGLAAAGGIYFVLELREGANGALLGLACGAALCIPLSAAFLARHLGWPVSRSEVAETLKLGLPFAAVSASEFLFPFLLRLVLLSTMGLAAVGVFGALASICLGLVMINDAFASAWWPYALSSEARDRVHGDTATVIRLYAFMLIVLAAALSLFARPLAAILLGGRVYVEAAGIVAPLALAYWIKSVRQNANVTLVTGGRNWTRAGLNLVTLLAALGLAIPSTARWGAEGAAWSFAAGEGLGLAIQALVMRSLFAITAEIRAPALAAAAFLALVVVDRALPASGAWAGVLERAALIPLFIAGLLLLRVVALSEIFSIARLVIHMVRPKPRYGWS